MIKVLIKILLLLDSFLYLLKIPRGTFLWKVNGVLLRNLKKSIVKIDGHIVCLDNKDSLGASLKEFEPKIRSIFKDKIKQGDTIIDVGANVGYHTLLLAKLVGGGKVYAFEPEPKAFGLLSKNIKQNGYKNVVLINKGLGEKEQVLDLYLNPKNAAGHSLIKRDNWQKQPVEIIALDDFLPKNTKVDFIKVDVEGSELSVFKGMKRILSENKNVKIITECISENGEDAFKFLSDLGFSIHSIDSTNLYCWR